MTTTDASPAADAAIAVERLRLAEARLTRRRQNDCGPSENARAAMRFILDRADETGAVTPTEIAAHLGVSTASVTGMLDRLHTGGLIAFAQNPKDRRSKLVIPFDRADDLGAVDPLTERIRALAQQLSEQDARSVSRFLALVREAVDAECA